MSKYYLLSWPLLQISLYMHIQLQIHTKMCQTHNYLLDSFWKKFFNLHVSSKLDCRFLSFPYYISTERDKPYDIWKKLVSLGLRGFVEKVQSLVFPEFGLEFSALFLIEQVQILDFDEAVKFDPTNCRRVL